MPYSIKKKNCKDSSGNKGKFIITKKGDNKKLSCHTSKEKAKSAVRARYANEDVNEINHLVYEKLLNYFSELNENYTSLSSSKIKEISRSLNNININYLDLFKSFNPNEKFELFSNLPSSDKKYLVNNIDLSLINTNSISDYDLYDILLRLKTSDITLKSIDKSLLSDEDKIYLSCYFNLFLDNDLEKVIPKLQKEFLTFKSFYDLYIKSSEEILQNLGFFSSKSKEGAERKVYFSESDFFVIKIARNNKGLVTNSNEVDISKGIHGKAAESIFVNVYEYDNQNINPVWIICEKVISLDTLNDLNILKELFPTFDRVTSFSINDPYQFKSLVTQTLIDYSKEIKSDDSYQKFLKDIKINLSNILDLEFNDQNFNEDIKPGRDFLIFKKSFSYINTKDLDSRNIGIRPSNKYSPNNIVILDFDINR